MQYCGADLSSPTRRRWRRSVWSKTLAVNLSAPFFLSQAAIPYLLEADGAIVNVTSSAAFVGEAYAAAYCASKWGLVGMTKAMAMEFQKAPIRINAVAPGGMMTNIAANLKMPQNADFRALIKRFSGMRGTVEVDDAADMILLLASDSGRGLSRRLHLDRPGHHRRLTLRRERDWLKVKSA